jgi:hypothetical protein
MGATIFSGSTSQDRCRHRTIGMPEVINVTGYARLILAPEKAFIVVTDLAGQPSVLALCDFLVINR